jgi:hypothetical protein
MSRRRLRVPGTHRTELLEKLEGEAKLLGLVSTVPCTVLANDGRVVEALATDNGRVADFCERHGDESGRDISTNWAIVAGEGEVIALLQIEAGDFEAPLLELAFPLPEAYDYIERVVASGTLALCSLQTGRVIGFDVASDFSVVKAGYAASLLIPPGAAAA